MLQAYVKTSFYSLHRETFSVTASQDHLANATRRFYSLHRETFSVTGRPFDS